MIRRGFWLTAGAVAGIYGYRRVSAAGRRLSATLTPEKTLELARAGARARGTSRRARRGAIALARESYRFSRDVREGMELYRRAHPATLATDRKDRKDRAPDRGDRAPDRGDRAAGYETTDHEPEDGH